MPNNSPQSSFRPGFRFSLFDLIIILTGAVGTFLAGTAQVELGICVAFVVSHFFLFCNVFRISRTPELIWAFSFIALATGSINFSTPPWFLTFCLSFTLSTFLIWRECKQPSYHGVFWKKWNPNLEKWWEAQRR